VFTGVSACAAVTTSPGAFENIAACTAIAAITADQATTPTGTTAMAEHTCSAVAAVAKSSCAPTIAPTAFHPDAAHLGIATVAGDSAVPTRIAAASTVVAIAAVADEFAGVTTSADPRTTFGVVREPVAAEKARTGVLLVAIFEQQVNARRRLLLDLGDHICDSAGAC
jgi:hypothetical protein